MSKSNPYYQDCLEEQAKILEAKVLERARQYLNSTGDMCRAINWREALTWAAKDLCKGWEWEIDEFISSKIESAHFTLTNYVGEHGEP